MDDDPPSYIDVMSGSAGSGRSRGDSSGGRSSSESGEVQSDSSSSLSTVRQGNLGASLGIGGKGSSYVSF